MKTLARDNFANVQKVANDLVEKTLSSINQKQKFKKSVTSNDGKTTAKKKKSGVHISATGVFKIFGNEPEKYLDMVKQGMGKQELLEEHKHVLGIQNVDLSVNYGQIHVVMGLSGSGKSTLIRHFESTC